MPSNHAQGFRPARASWAAIGVAKGLVRIWSVLRVRPLSAATVALTLVLVGAFGMSEPKAERAPEKLSPPFWQEIARPLPMFALQAPELSRLAEAYAVRRKSDESARQDILVFGTLEDRQAYLRLMVHRGAPDAGATLYVEAARRAGESGLGLSRLNPPAVLKTRFGEGEYAQAVLSTSAGASTREGCAAFLLNAPGAALRISGLACGPDGAAFDRKRLACLVDRLDLLGAGDDLGLKTFFAEAELQRDHTCAARSKSAFAAPAPAAAPEPDKPRESRKRTAQPRRSVHAAR